MSVLPKTINQLHIKVASDYGELIAGIESIVAEAGYIVIEKNINKPWGAYLRIDSLQANEFVRDFFPELSPEEAHLGMESAELSPKLLIVKPGQRLSWQYHDRRAERWCFLTPGAYRKSQTDNESGIIAAESGDVVQIQKGERHRLEGLAGGILLVAEIWQHTEPGNPSDEDDIVRLADDYIR